MNYCPSYKNFSMDGKKSKSKKGRKKKKKHEHVYLRCYFHKKKKKILSNSLSFTSISGCA